MYSAKRRLLDIIRISTYVAIVVSGLFIVAGFFNSQYASAHHGGIHYPGDVSNNLSLWLKADSGLVGTNPVLQWNDQSVNGYNFDLSEGDPNSTSDVENFNPTVAFDGAGDALGRNGDIGVSSTEDATYFLVTTKDAGSGAILELYPTGTFASPLASNNFTFLLTNDTNPLFNNLQATQIGNTSNGNVNIFTDPNTPAVGIPSIFSFRKDNTANLSAVSINAVPPAANEADTYDIDPVVAILGRNKNFDIDFDGTISEVIVYDSNLSDTDIQSIQSYLAVKYGIDLDNSTDYVDTDGNTIWSIGTNSSFPDNTFGIGRDDDATLDQRISSSQNVGTILTVALDPDFSSPNNDPGRTTTFTSDLEFAMFSDNAGAITAGTAELPLSGVYEDRIEREWKPTFSGGFSDPLNFKFEGMGGDSWRLIHSTSGNLASGGAVITDLGPLDADGEATNITLPAGGVITLARIAESPGGVSGNLSLWLRANAGTSTTTNGADVTGWTDQSSVSNDATAGTTQNPFYTENGANFNPALSYDPASTAFADRESLVVNPSLLPIGTSSRSIVLVLNPEDNHYATNTTYYGPFNYGDWGSGSGDFIGLEPNTSGFRVGYGGYAETSSATSPDQQVITLTLGENVNTDEGLYYFNGGSQALSTNGNGSVQLVNTGTAGANIGAVDGGGRYVGEISEVIVYEEDLSVTDLQQVHSYVALKYGITLDQSSATAYLASDGTTKMWDEIAGVGYDNDIFGIGRDDVASLDQRVSKSVNTGSIFTVSLDGDDFTKANISVVNTFDDDLDFLAFANDGGATTTQTTEISASYGDRITREWQVQNTGTVGAVNVKFDGFAGYDLIASTDSDFSDFDTANSGDTLLGVLDANGELTNIIFADGVYLTLAEPDTTAPVTPVGPPDMTSATDTGSSDTDNLTNDTTPNFDVMCTEVGSTITVFTDEPSATAPNSTGTHTCVGTGTETATAISLPGGTQNITYTETDAAGNESGLSLALPIEIDALSPSTPTVNSPTSSGPVEVFPNIDINVDCESISDTITVYGPGIAPDPTTHVCTSVGPVDIPVVLTEDGPAALNVTAADSAGNESAAATVVFSTGTSTDTDGDGISDDDENTGLNNGDGTPDYQQTFVSSRTSPVNSTPVTLESSGSDCQLINGYEIIAESANEVSDSNFDYPIGLHDYTLQCLSAGATATVTFYFDQLYDTTEWTWRKFDRNGEVYASMQNEVTYGTATIGSTTVTTATYSITDGGPLDEDGVANGVIVDPSGPAVLVEDLADTGSSIASVFVVGLSLVMIVRLVNYRTKS